MNSNVRRYLIELARHPTNQTIAYQKLADDCNLDMNFRDEPYDRFRIGDLLGDISKFEFNHGRPMLSALVLRAVDGEEGDGFYKLAGELHNRDWRGLKEGLFQIQEINKCIEFWTNDSNYNKFR